MLAKWILAHKSWHHISWLVRQLLLEAHQLSKTRIRTYSPISPGESLTLYSWKKGYFSFNVYYKKITRKCNWDMAGVYSQLTMISLSQGRVWRPDLSAEKASLQYAILLVLRNPCRIGNLGNQCSPGSIKFSSVGKLNFNKIPHQVGVLAAE